MEDRSNQQYKNIFNAFFKRRNRKRKSNYNRITISPHMRVFKKISDSLLGGMAMNSIRKLSNLSHLLPLEITADIHKRIIDWLASGGNEDDPYIEQQLRYVNNFLKMQRSVSK